MSLALHQDSETAVCRRHLIRTIQSSRKALLGGVGGGGPGLARPGWRLSRAGRSWWGGWGVLGQGLQAAAKMSSELEYVREKEFPRAHVDCAEKDVEMGPRNLH